MHWLQVSLPSVQPSPLRAPQGQMPVSAACCPLSTGAQPCFVGTQDEEAELVSWGQGTVGSTAQAPAQSDLALMLFLDAPVSPHHRDPKPSRD